MNDLPTDDTDTDETEFAHTEAPESEPPDESDASEPVRVPPTRERFFVRSKLTGTVTFRGVEWIVTHDADAHGGGFWAKAPSRDADWSCSARTYVELLDAIWDTTEECTERDNAEVAFEDLCTEVLRVPDAQRIELAARVLLTTMEEKPLLDILWSAMAQREKPETKPADPATVPMAFAEIERRVASLGMVDTWLLTSVLLASFPASFSFWDFAEAVANAHDAHERIHPLNGLVR